MQKSTRDGLVLLALGAFLIMVPSFLTPKPSVGQHKLLVATEEMPSDLFDNKVVLLSRHDSQGAFGLIINDGDNGGPVAKDRRFVLHSVDVLATESMLLPEKGTAITEKEGFPDKTKPEKSKVLYGYSGWGKGQLDRELDKGHWKLVGFDKELVFDVPDDQVWDIAIKREAVFVKEENKE